MLVPAATDDPSDGTTRVGIVVAAYNAEAYLGETLASIARQDVVDWRCVVVDDGSVDDTAAIAEGFAARDDRFHVVRQANSGVSAARNVGLQALPQTTWVAFLDSDDTWLPATLDVLLEAVAARPDAVGVYGLAEYMDEQGRPIHPGVHPAVQRDRRRAGRIDLHEVDPGEDGTFESLVVSGTIWPPGVGLFRRSVVRRVGGFDPDQLAAEDWDLFLRMSRHGPFVPVEQQVCWYRQHGSNATADEQKMAYYYAGVRWKAWTSTENTAAQRWVVRRVWLSLHLRSLVWTLTAFVRACRAGEWPTARAAAAATAVFTVELARCRPSPPTRRSAGYTAQFIAARRAPALTVVADRGAEGAGCGE